MIKQTFFLMTSALALLTTFSCGTQTYKEHKVTLSSSEHIEWFGNDKAIEGRNYKARANIKPGYMINTTAIRVQVGEEVLTAADYMFGLDNGTHTTGTLVIFAESIKGDITITGDAIATDYINVADYVDTTGNTDTSKTIQDLIDNNPHRTLFFRDGIYRLDKPILTPGKPEDTVDLRLANFAVLRASDKFNIVRQPTPDHKWQDNYNYMVGLAGKDRVNDTTKIGSNFSMVGGYLDGGPNHAPGIEIAGGREVRVQNVSMKNVKIGLRIAPGVNSNSSDADVLDLNIICDESEESLGMLIDGYDNSITNVRIGHTIAGVKLNGGGNVLRNIHPLLNGNDSNPVWTKYDDSYGFEVNNENILDYCYSDNFHVAFKIPKSRALFHNCFAWWWNPKEHAQILIQNSKGTESPHLFRSIFTNLQVGFDAASGHYSIEHPSIILDNQETAEDANKPTLITNLAVCNRSTVKDVDKDAYHGYFTGADIDY